MNDDWDGWCGGWNVNVEDGRVTNVLGPDGEPIRYSKRHAIGFDLRPKPQKSKGPSNE